MDTRAIIKKVKRGGYRWYELFDLLDHPDPSVRTTVILRITVTAEDEVKVATLQHKLRAIAASEDANFVLIDIVTLKHFVLAALVWLDAALADTELVTSLSEADREYVVQRLQVFFDEEQLLLP